MVSDSKSKKEILLVQIILGIVFLFAFLDIKDDFELHTPNSHLFTDISLAVIAICLLFVLLRRTKLVQVNLTKLSSAFFSTKEEAESAKQQVEIVKKEAEQERRRADELTVQAAKNLEEKRLLLKGLGQVIDAQLEKWDLSAAEKEIALLLLKGLSHSDIAEIRKTSERTVRQQSLKIYSKAGLKGRSDLAAFFIEDMLASIEAPKN